MDEKVYLYVVYVNISKHIQEVDLGDVWNIEFVIIVGGYYNLLIMSVFEMQIILI